MNKIKYLASVSITLILSLFILVSDSISYKGNSFTRQNTDINSNNIICTHWQSSTLREGRNQNSIILSCAYRDKGTVFLIEAFLVRSPTRGYELRTNIPYLVEGNVNNRYNILVTELLENLEQYLITNSSELISSRVSQVSIVHRTTSSILRDRLLERGYILGNISPILLTDGHRFKLIKLIELS